MRNKISNVGKVLGGTVAVMLVMVTVSANISPSFAYAMNEVPLLGSIVRVVTLNRYENKIGGSEATIVTPQIEGLKDEKLMEEINSELGENAQKLIEEFEKEANALMEEYGEDVHMGFESDYIVRTDTDDYYAIDIYYFNVVGSSSTTHKFYTVNKKTGEIVTLKGLFKENADYITPISTIVKDEMIRRNNEEEGLFWVEKDEYTDGYQGITEDVKFLINDKGNIVICYDKYEVAAGAQGCPEFEIDKELIKDILK
ncbi:MAG: DUF3298 domain-containing protein [Clostridia bacterium]